MLIAIHQAILTSDEKEIACRNRYQNGGANNAIK
jgi:hypothetical protein